MLGRSLAHYKITERLGQGAMGEVYRARDTKLDRDVAIKVLPEDLARDPDRRKRFTREAKAVAALRHPNIVMMHSVEEVDGVHFLTMELVEGRTLSEVLPPDGFSLSRFFEYSIALTDAISAAHAKGIVHRDLKPANIMIDSDGRLRVLDFGLAKIFDANLGEGETVATEDLTTHGAIVGTVAFMSPEQAEGGAIDHRSDVFSMGVLLYEMATGKRPFEGKSSISTLSAILKDTPPTITEVKSTLPRHLGRIVNRCLAKEPERRYQSALEVRNELDALRTEITSGALELPAEVSRAGGDEGGDRGGSRGRFPKWVGAAAAGVVLVAVVAALVQLLPRGDATAPEATGSSTGSTPGGSTGGAPERSIAVLPFVNMSEDASNDFFSDGLAEELLNLLAKVPDLRVAARTSSFQFKGHTGDVSEIGERLNVATILEGSVRRAQNRVRVTAQLVKASDGFHMWSETYDRELDDIFAIQEEIATHVVDALKITLMGEAAAQLAKRPTDNMQAYDAYLLGQQRLARRQSDALEEAVEYYGRAVELDPNFAQAYAQRAVAYLLLYEYGSLGRDEVNAKATEMIERAFEIDDRLGIAYAAQGLLQADSGDDLAATESYKRAIELNPNYAVAYMWYAMTVRGTDRDKAWELLRKSLELDPLAPVTNVNVGYWLMFDGKPREALEQFEKVIEIDPGFPSAYAGMAVVYADHYDQPEEALRWRRKAVELDPSSLSRRESLGWAYFNAGRADEAMEVFRGSIESDPRFARGYDAIADLHRSRGRLDEAVRWQQKAIQRDPEDVNLRISLFFYYTELSDERAMARVIEQIDEAFPGFPYLPLGHATLAELHGDLDEADRLWRSVAEQAPEAFRSELANLDLKLGRAREVRDRWEQAYPGLFHDEDPHVNASNVKNVIDVCYSLQASEDRERRDLLLRKSEAFLMSRSEAVRRNRFPWELFEIRILEGRLDEALSLAEELVEDGSLPNWWSRLDPMFWPIVDHPRWLALVARIRRDMGEMRLALAEEGLATGA